MVNVIQISSEEYVQRIAGMKGIKVEDCRKRKPGVGYDFLFIYPDGHEEKIEVKGTKRENGGIPDMRISEFGDKKLIADYLYVVGNAGEPDDEKILYVIPRDEIKPDKLKLLSTYRVYGFGKKRLPQFRKIP